MYNELKTLLENRRTPRYVDRDDIPEDDINKILDAAKLAPSFDKVYPYEIYVLTNSQAGINKKEELVERYICRPDDYSASPNVGTSWNNREIVQPILSGVSLVYIAITTLSPTMETGEFELYLTSQRDAMVSATYAMLAAESLGYCAGMFSAIVWPGESARLLFTDTEKARVVTTVTVANKVIPASDPLYSRQFIDYKDQKPYVYHSKHRDKVASPKITIL
jgi:nitroreductase